MAINGKKKGNKNERDLTKWWTTWTGMEFSRVPASGGLRWQKKDDISGDIICTDERKSRRFAFTIETKSYKDINFEHVLLGNKGVKILEFWDQAKEDGERANKIPLLFMRYNNMPKQTWFVVMGLKTFNYFYQLNRNIKEETYMIIEDRGINRLVVLNSDTISKTDFNEIHKKLKIAKRNGFKY